MATVARLAVSEELLLVHMQTDEITGESTTLGSYQRLQYDCIATHNCGWILLCMLVGTVARLMFSIKVCSFRLCSTQ